MDVFMQIMLFSPYCYLGKFIKKILDLVCMKSVNKVTKERAQCINISLMYSTAPALSLRGKDNSNINSFFLLDFIPVAYQSVHYPLKFCQLMQALEIFHPLFGYTKGSVMEPTVQVGGRSIILFCLIEAESRIQDKPVIFYLILCWSIIELFR
jgi:hypothetical protein